MGGKNRFFYIGMAVGFGLAFVVLWLAMPYIQKMTIQQPVDEQRAETANVDPDAVEREGMTRFLEAAKSGDFTAMQNEGSRIFTPGKVIPDSTVLLAPYRVNSHPPYQVYAFLTENTDKATRRVLLTMDERDRIESFLAEEMAVVP